MPDWGTVLGSGYDAFFDRKDKNREFQLRKQQEDALNTLRQIQIQAALENAQRQKAVQAGQQGLMEEINAPALNSPHGYPAPVGMMTQPTYQQRLERLAVDDPEKALPLLGSYENKEAALQSKEFIAELVNNARLQAIEAANQRAKDYWDFRERESNKTEKPNTDDSEKLRKQNIAELEKHLKIYEPILKKYQGVDISVLDENSKKQYENYRRGYNKTLETLNKIKNREINNVTWGAYNPNNPEQNTPQQPSKVIRFNSKGERI
jgi:hypothetical protein